MLAMLTRCLQAEADYRSSTDARLTKPLQLMADAAEEVLQGMTTTNLGPGCGGYGGPQRLWSHADRRSLVAGGTAVTEPCWLAQPPSCARLATKALPFRSTVLRDGRLQPESHSETGGTPPGSAGLPPWMRRTLT